jgi:soluble lytic murein transglycosylase
MSLAPLALLALATAGPARPSPENFAKALAAFRADDYAQAARMLPALDQALPANRDYYLHFLAESQFYAGQFSKAAMTFAELGKMRDSRFAALAPWRGADCLWMQGKHDEAAAVYRKLLGGSSEADRAVARFRVAVVMAEQAARHATDQATTEAATEAAALAFKQLHLDFPAHPLGIEAGKRAAALAPASMRGEGQTTPQERLRRAATLAKSRRWQEALDELALLPTALPADLADERDVAMGMAKYQTRRDYAGAAALLLGVAPKLSGEKAAFAAFHGARALSRIDRNDEAIAGYRSVVAKYPSASWAAEAQFRAGWLEVNRARFREALPDLRQTLVRYPKSKFAADAAWYLTLSNYMLGDATEALKALATYERLAHDSEAAMRVCYWRARMLAQTAKADDAKALLRECAQRDMFNYYGLLARARLRELGETLPWPSAPGRAQAPAPLRDAVVARALELERVGLVAEAGTELARGEAALLKRNGKARALPFLFSAYPRFLAFHQAHKLAEANGEDSVPDARLYWEASYPRAYRETVETFGKAAGNPDLFLYAIMRKESGYFPFAVSPADARGLLQLIPTTGDEVAKSLGLTVYADELFIPDTNIHLGAAYLGGLLHRFHGQEALAAGAYNAGAHAMMRWCDQWGGKPLDEFVELITYDQARDYIKRTLGIYARYRLLYSEPLELPLTVNAQYLKEGPDY